MIHNSVHNSPSLVLILRHTNPVHNLKSYLFNIHFNIILPRTPRSKWFLPFRSFDNTLKKNRDIFYIGATLPDFAKLKFRSWVWSGNQDVWLAGRHKPSRSQFLNTLVQADVALDRHHNGWHHTSDFKQQKVFPFYYKVAQSNVTYKPKTQATAGQYRWRHGLARIVTRCVAMCGPGE
jgi:hypothetical protein